MSNIQEVKQRFGIIGNHPALDRAIFKAIQVAPTDISVLVTGESGVGKEAIPKIIHHLSHRKHAPLIAVNCGAIPEGTMPLASLHLLNRTYQRPICFSFASPA